MQVRTWQRFFARPFGRGFKHDVRGDVVVLVAERQPPVHIKLQLVAVLAFHDHLKQITMGLVS